MARAAPPAGNGSSESGSGATGETTASPVGEAFDRAALALAEQSAGVGVWSIDLPTSRLRATAQFYRIMGLEPTSDSIPIEAVRALRHPEDRERVLAGFRDALEGGSDTYEIEYRIIRPDGNLRWIFGRGRVIRDRNGTPVRYSGVDLDITDRKATEAALTAATQELERMNQVLEQRVRERTAELEVEAARRAEAESRLRQAQKMEAVGQLTGGIAHDFNNILQVIMGNLEILKLSLQRDSADGGTTDRRPLVDRAIATAQKAALSAKELIQRLLAFGRQQPLVPASLDVNRLVREMTEIIERALGATIDVEARLSPGVWPIYADRNQLESALLNLILNSRDAMPQGGRLLVETANIDLRENCLDDLTPGRYVTLIVGDTGCGIPRDHLPRVFDPFFTTKDPGKGSGLGLSMVYGFAKQSGGHVRIHSDVGSGTTVRIFLPCPQEDDLPKTEGVRAPPGTVGALPFARAGETVLLVEDDDEVRRVGVSALEDLGYQVIEAADGSSALRNVEASKSVRIDLLLTDVVLPGGMSGGELALAIRQQRPRLAVLFTSGHTRTAAMRGGLSLEFPLLGKPYSFERLAMSCRQAIDAAAALDNTGT